MGKEQEYREIFLAEAQESHEKLNLLFTELEKDNTSRKAIDAIFRITHTLKGNAMGMGFSEIAEMSHVMEDVFNEVKNGKLVLDAELFGALFRANDILGELIEAITSAKHVKYKGIKTKLEVVLRNHRQNIPSEVPEITETVKSDELAIVQENQESSRDDLVLALEDLEETHLSKVTISDTVQVPVRKLDALLNIVGELIIEKDSLIAKYTEIGHKASEFARLHRIASDLQYGVMDVRLVQIGFLFNKFHRVLRDVASIENKKVDLVLEGTEIEIDRNVLRIMSDSLVHMVRNSVSHGIEKPAKRLEKGKPEQGKVTLRGRNEKDTIYIEIEDDGAGIDTTVIKRKALEKKIISEEYAKVITNDEILHLIFEPGFSNAEEVTEVSGRGVGMDVVKRATESIGGKVEIFTKIGKGTRFVLTLPSSMAVKGALLFELDKQEFAIPLTYTEAVVSLRKKDLHKYGKGLVTSYLGKSISLVFLKDLFALPNLASIELEGALHKSYDDLPAEAKLDVVIVSYAERFMGIVVDKLLQQKEIVEKNLNNPVDKNDLFCGATILGNGNVCLVLDIVAVLRTFYMEKMRRQNVAA
jgi:two-component system, chemotaxis family, sensor kinase CheA